MFKRANKITSLLVTAAAVMSLVPAYASDVTKVTSEDGTIYNAVAYKNGQFYIDGEVNDKDEAAYYLAGGKYNDLSDIDAGADIATYGAKYVEVEGGDYFVDLTSGKVTDDSVADDARDDAASNLRKKVKADTDGRYVTGTSDNEAGSLKTYDATTASAVTVTDSTDTAKEIYSISGNKFGDEWFETAYANKDAANGYASNATDGFLTVFTDGNGGYVDADYNLGKIKVETTTGSATKSVYVSNTTDEYDTATSGISLQAKVRDGKVIGQDKDYVYRFATVSVYTETAADGTTVAGPTISKIDGRSVSANTAIFDTATANTVSFNVIQKISKAQSTGEIGGVKYAKTAYTYLLADDSDTLVDKADFKDYENYTIADGKVTGYGLADDASGTVTVHTTALKSEESLYYIDESDSSNDDVELYDTTEAVQTDVDGNLWRLNGGYVYEWNNDSDWDKVYKVDGSFDQLSVYDKSNIVAWNQDDAVYSIIGGKTTTTDTTTDTTGTTTTPVVTVTAGWTKAADGTWTYAKADGTKATGWLQDGAAWYYLNATGTMATGWVNDKGTWYYLNGSGAMATGWVNDGGSWYYLAGSGAMLSNTVVDGYKLGASGAWVK